MSCADVYFLAKRFLRKKLHPRLPQIKAILFYLQLCIDIPLLALKICFKIPRGTVLLCLNSPASMGGTELQVHLIAVRLKKMGLKPLVLTTGSLPKRSSSEFFKRLKQGEIAHFHLGNVGLAKHLLFQKCRTALFEKMQADFCHCFNPTSTLLIDSAKKAGLKIFYSETGWPEKGTWWSPLLTHIDKIESVAAISAASLSRLRTELGYKGPAMVIHSLIDPPSIPIRARSSVVKELKIVYFGCMHLEKGVQLLLSAFQKFLPIYPSASLTFIGRGPVRRDLEKQVIHSKLEHHIFFSDFKRENAFYEQISHFDLMCLPSFSEGAPCSILESLSIGLPVLATCVGGIPELIEENVSGILIPPHDETALVQALTRFALDLPLRRRISENGLQRFQNHLTPARRIQQLHSLYTNDL